jgi:transcriptional regulator with XRE-family HTH domain
MAMRIPLRREVAGKIELALARFSRGWEGLDPLRRGTAAKAVMLAEMLGGRAKAAEVAGVADNTLDNYRHGKKDPKLRTLELMADRAGVSASYLGGEWLLEGDSIRIELAQAAGLRDYASVLTPPGLMDNPPQPYLHGYDEVRPASTAAKTLEDYWKRIGLHPDAVTTLVAEGDSMAPTIADQAPVFIDTDDRDLADGGIYAIKVGGNLVIRRVQRLVDGGLQLLADNGVAYPPQTVDDQALANLEIVGRVRSAAVAC